MAQATEVVALVKGVAELPCDVTTATEPATDDPVRLVLWYRIDSSTPIYRYARVETKWRVCSLQTPITSSTLTSFLPSFNTPLLLLLLLLPALPSVVRLTSQLQVANKEENETADGPNRIMPFSLSFPFPPFKKKKKSQQIEVRRKELTLFFLFLCMRNVGAVLCAAAVAVACVRVYHMQYQARRSEAIQVKPQLKRW